MDLGDIFNQSISDIKEQQKQSRGEQKEIIQKVGIFEIFEYLISRTNLPLEDQTKSERDMTNILVKIAQKMISKKFGENKSPLKKMTVEEFKGEEKNDVYRVGIFVYLEGDDEWDGFCALVLNALSFTTFNKHIIIARNDNHRPIVFSSETSKTIIIHKLINLILNNEGEQLSPKF